VGLYGEDEPLGMESQKTELRTPKTREESTDLKKNRDRIKTAGCYGEVGQMP
jgi:hypothetical protein